MGALGARGKGEQICHARTRARLVLLRGAAHGAGAPTTRAWAAHVCMITPTQYPLPRCQVQEAAVIGVPDAKWGERPLLVAVPKPPASPGDALRRELLAYMAAHPAVAKFAVPDDVLFVEAIPYGATGKVRGTQGRGGRPDETNLGWGLGGPPAFGDQCTSCPPAPAAHLRTSTYPCSSPPLYRTSAFPIREGGAGPAAHKIALHQAVGLSTHIPPPLTSPATADQQGHAAAVGQPAARQRRRRQQRRRGRCRRAPQQAVTPAPPRRVALLQRACVCQVLRRCCAGVEQRRRGRAAARCWPAQLSALLSAARPRVAAAGLKAPTKRGPRAAPLCHTAA